MWMNVVRLVIHLEAMILSINANALLHIVHDKAAMLEFGNHIMFVLATLTQQPSANRRSVN